MDISTATSTAYAQKSPTQVSREVRQSTQAKGVEENIQKRFQTEGRHAEKVRIANEVFKDTVETTDSAAVDDGIDQMVRAVSRQRASEQSTESDSVEEQDPAAREQFVRQKVDSAYSGTENQPSQRETNPSQADQTARQQQQAAEVYRASNRARIDRTVELVI